MKKKGQRNFNNENVHRIKMLHLPLSSVFSMAAGHLSSARLLPKAPSQYLRQNVPKIVPKS